VNVVHFALTCQAARNAAAAVVMALDRTKIVEAAMEILRVDGLSAVNMRSVAARLDVGASALYRHFSSKEAILGAMVTCLFEAAQQDLSPELAWRDWLFQFGHRLRAQLLEFPDSALMCVSAPPQSNDVGEVSRQIARPLTSRGISSDEAVVDIASVIALTTGWTAYQQSTAKAEFLEQLFGFDQAFDKSLRSLIAGIGSA
jgi:TetR/AcrR family tetracycline transcriptional repressor